MATYLVTGAAGFIASRVAGLLLEQGHRVVGVDNLNDAYDVRIKHYRLERLRAHPEFHFFHLDIGERASLAPLWDEQWDFSAVINLAARAGVRVSLVDPWVYMNTNLTGTLNLLELSRERGIPKFVLASTSSIYGANAPLPTPESAESSRPLQPYAASKKAAEVLCHSYHYLYGLDVSVVRYFTVYGPAGRPDMVMFRFCKWIEAGEPVKINGDGEQTRGFTYLDDIARGTLLALQPVGYEIFNLGGHEVISLNALLKMFETRLGKTAQVVHAPFHPADMLANCADVSKAQRILGWQPQVELAAGVDALVDWYLAQRAWASQLLID